MLFHLLKLYARLAIRLYCRKIIINKPEFLHAKGPLLLAANHPNSFLDGIILTTLFEERIYSLARGDVFKNPKANRILRWVGLFPVFRTSEGTENLGHNYTTFEYCLEGFEKKKVVLIFSEGRCENEWHLRPLRKGTARLANSAWERGIPLTILPVGINYSSFKKFGKDIHIHFGTPFSEMEKDINYGRNLLSFNQELNGQLEDLVYEIEPNDTSRHRSVFSDRISVAKRVLLFLPAIIGAFLHLPFYLLVKGITHWKFRESGHYDSVLHAGMMILYPLYILLVSVLLFQLHPAVGIASVILLPITAWSYAQKGFTII